MAWIWCFRGLQSRQAATAPIPPLAWEPPLFHVCYPKKTHTKKIVQFLEMQCFETIWYRLLYSNLENFIETLDLCLSYPSIFAFSHLSMEKFDQWIETKTMLIY